MTRRRKRRPPKSWRVCPYCYGRATKIFNMSNGKYECQQCGKDYLLPDGQLPTALQWVFS